MYSDYILEKIAFYDAGEELNSVIEPNRKVLDLLLKENINQLKYHINIQ